MHQNGSRTRDDYALRHRRHRSTPRIMSEVEKLSMTQTTPREEPALSVILTTDTRETIRGVLRRLQQQTAQARMEIIMVVPRGQGASFGEGDARGFADFRIIEMEDIQPLRKARAIGVRASTAPLVFLGETHAYPHPEWAEAMINAGACADWASITPAFGNANP